MDKSLLCKVLGYDFTDKELKEHIGLCYERFCEVYNNRKGNLDDEYYLRLYDILGIIQWVQYSLNYRDKENLQVFISGKIIDN